MKAERTKTFDGGSMAEVLAKVKRELGADAVILGSRTRESGILGRSVEVTVDLGASVRMETTEESLAELEAPALLKGRKAPHRTGLWAAPGHQHAIVDDSVADALIGPLPKKSGRRKSGALRYETADEAGELSSAHLPSEPAQNNARTRRKTVSPSMAEQLKELRSLMMRMGGAVDWLGQLIVDADIAAAPAAALRDALHGRLQGNSSAQGRRAALHGAIRTLVGNRQVRDATIMALVGPTGVGKTTTIAKLAADARFSRHERVQLICFDAFRVGAVAQLQQYAELLDAPLTVVSEPSELQDAIDGAVRDDGADLVLVDTAGRNPGDAAQVPLLAEAFSEHAVQVHLCIPVATRRQELSLVLTRFEQLHPAALLFTKLDEAVGLGGILNGIVESQRGVSYVTHGQRVPEDFLRADDNWLARSIAQSVWNSWRGGDGFSQLINDEPEMGDVAWS